MRYGLDVTVKVFDLDNYESKTDTMAVQADNRAVILSAAGALGNQFATLAFNAVHKLFEEQDAAAAEDADEDEEDFSK